MLRNVSGQKWRVYAWDTTTGQAKTGDASNISGRITKDFGTPAATDDTAPTEVDATNEKGFYEFTLTQSETDAHTLSLSCQSSTSDIAVLACKPVQNPVPQYLSLLGIESDGDLNKVNTLDGHTAQTGDNYARIGANGSGLTSLATASALTTVDTVVDGIKAVTDNIPDSGSMSDLAAILADTNELQTDWANGGRLDLILDACSTYDGSDTSGTTTLLTRLSSARAGYLDKLNVSGVLAHTDNATSFMADVSGLATSANVTTIVGHLTDIKGAGWTTTDTLEAIRDRGDAAWITATSVTVSDKTGFSLATPPPTANENADALLDRTDGVESGWTLRQWLRIGLALFAGNSTNGGKDFANPAGTKTRIQSTIDGSNNRTVTSRDVT